MTPPASQASKGGLRERKKRAMRQQLSDTAARMFLERDFDAVRVADVAEACGVSEKTVFNYFPTKEALLLERLEGMNDALRVHLANPRLSPLAGMLKILELELHDLSTSLTTAPDQDAVLAAYRRFGDLVREIPSLRAYQSDVAGRCVDVAAEVLAARAGLEPTDPEPQIAATALLGLWRVQFRALRIHLRPGRPIRDVVDAVTDKVRRAALLIENGLATFPCAPSSAGTDARD